MNIFKRKKTSKKDKNTVHPKSMRVDSCSSDEIVSSELHKETISTNGEISCQVKPDNGNMIITLKLTVGKNSLNKKSVRKALMKIFKEYLKYVSELSGELGEEEHSFLEESIKGLQGICCRTYKFFRYLYGKRNKR